MLSLRIFGYILVHRVTVRYTVSTVRYTVSTFEDYTVSRLLPRSTIAGMFVFTLPRQMRREPEVGSSSEPPMKKLTLLEAHGSWVRVLQGLASGAGASPAADKPRNVGWLPGTLQNRKDRSHCRPGRKCFSGVLDPHPCQGEEATGSRQRPISNFWIWPPGPSIRP